MTGKTTVISWFTHLVCVSLGVVDKHDSFPVEVVENIDEEQRQRVKVRSDTCQRRELVETVDRVVSSHCGGRQHGYVPVARLTRDRRRRIVAARSEKHIHLELQQRFYVLICGPSL